MIDKRGTNKFLKEGNEDKRKALNEFCFVLTASSRLFRLDSFRSDSAIV